MPTRSERLYLYPDLHPGRQPESGQVLEFPFWWDRREFFNRFKAREVDCSNPVDDKSAYLLFVDEAYAFDKDCLAQSTKRLGTLPTHIQDQNTEFLGVLRRSKWIIVESYEWD